MRLERLKCSVTHYFVKGREVLLTGTNVLQGENKEIQIGYV